jgi:hypothetical protein
MVGFVGALRRPIAAILVTALVATLAVIGIQSQSPANSGPDRITGFDAWKRGLPSTRPGSVVASRDRAKIGSVGADPGMPPAPPRIAPAAAVAFIVAMTVTTPCAHLQTVRHRSRSPPSA